MVKHRTWSALLVIAQLISFPSPVLAQGESDWPFEKAPLQTLSSANIKDVQLIGKIGDTPNIFQSVPVSPDGKQFALVMNRSLDIYTASPLTRTLTIPALPAQNGFRARWHPTQNQIAVSQSNGDQRFITVYSSTNGKPIQKIALPKNSRDFEYTPDGKFIIVSDKTGLQVIDSATGQSLNTIPLDDEAYFLFRPNTNDSKIAIHLKSSFRVIDVSTGKALTNSKIPELSLYSAEPSLSMTKIVGTSSENLNAILVIDGSPPREIKAHDRVTYSFAWHPDEKRLLSAGADGYVKVFNLDSMTHTLSIAPLGRETIQAVEWLAADQILSVGESGAIAIVDSKSGKIVERTIGSFPEYSRSVALSQDGKWLATGSIAGQVRVFDVSSGNLTWRFDDLYAGVDQIAFSPDGRNIGAVTNENAANVEDLPPLIDGKPSYSVAIWDLKTGKIVLLKEGVRKAIGFTRDSKNAIVCGINGESGPYVQINLASKNARPMNEKCYANFAIHPKLNRIADFRSLIEYSGQNTGIVYKTRLDEVRPSYTIVGPSIFSADGSLAAHHGTKFIRICDALIKNKLAPDGARAKPCQFKATFTSSEWLRTLSFSPDNKFLLYDDGRGGLSIGDIDSSRTIKEFQSSTQSNDAVAWFLLDGKRVLVYGDGLEIWGKK
jgi:WD40 repeat protein